MVNVLFFQSRWYLKTECSSHSSPCSQMALGCTIGVMDGNHPRVKNTQCGRSHSRSCILQSFTAISKNVDNFFLFLIFLILFFCFEQVVCFVFFF